jgi:hypothetical protein
MSRGGQFVVGSVTVVHRPLKESGSRQLLGITDYNELRT